MTLDNTKFTNTESQALSHFSEAANVFGAIHSLNFRALEDPQMKALLPIVIPKLEDKVRKSIELAITQWQLSKTTG